MVQGQKYIITTKEQTIDNFCLVFYAQKVSLFMRQLSLVASYNLEFARRLQSNSEVTAQQGSQKF